TNPLWKTRVTWSAAIIICVLFFGSILLHELAHALVAKVYRIPVRTIMLFALGGIARIEKDAATPAAEFWMGIAGPVMSGAVGFFCAWSAGWLNADSPTVGINPPAAILLSLSSLNFMLAMFNLIPGFPLDGGRIVRAVLWRIWGDEDRATKISARIGQGVALAFFGIGLWGFISSANLSGLWLGLLGWFLLDAATGSYVQVEALTGLRGISVGEVMSHNCPTVGSAVSVQRFADEYVLKTGRRCYAVEEAGRIIGLVTPADLSRVERSRWGVTTIAQVFHPLHQLRCVSPDTPVADALQTMGREDLNQLPVMESGRMEGVLSRSHIMHVLHRRAELSM
ncbi:MAG TPA: site-2 protease family protein, partial [Nitrospira sp.]